MTRDLCVALHFLLSGRAELHNSPDEKFDRKSEEYWIGATKISNVKRFNERGIGKDGGYEAMIFPNSKDAKQKGWDWQIQIWEQYASSFLPNMLDVLKNQMMELNNGSINIRKLDFAIWQYGLHDWGSFSEPPHGKRFFNFIFVKYLEALKDIPTTPHVWMSMNPNCGDKIAVENPHIKDQPKMVEDTNRYILDYTRNNSVPYFDSAAPFRLDVAGNFRRCDISGDGVHSKMWVDIMRAKILLNHLCDDDMNWVGNTNRFVDNQ